MGQWGERQPRHGTGLQHATAERQEEGEKAQTRDTSGYELSGSKIKAVTPWKVQHDLEDLTRFRVYVV